MVETAYRQLSTQVRSALELNWVTIFNDEISVKQNLLKVRQPTAYIIHS